MTDYGSFGFVTFLGHSPAIRDGVDPSRQAVAGGNL